MLRTAGPLIYLLAGALTASVLRTDSSANEVAAHFHAGVEASRAGQFDRAVTEYKAVLRLEPALPEAHTDLGLAYHSLGQYEAAISEFKTALSEKPDLTAATLFLGIDYLRLGWPARAAVPLEAVVRVQPSNREARQALTTCYLNQNRYRQAADQLRVLSSLQTEKAESLYALARGYLDFARRLSDEMSLRYQGTPWANRLAGDLLSESFRWTDAAIMYRQALKLDDHQPEVHASLGNAYLKQEDLSAAQQQFQAALQLDPRNQAALFGLSEIHLLNGEARIACQLLDQTWAAFPLYLQQRSDLQSPKLEPGKAHEMIADLETLPESPAKHFLLASLYNVIEDERNRQTEQAIVEDALADWAAKEGNADKAGRDSCALHEYAACARKFQSERPRSISSGLMLGEALYALGQHSQAADAFADVLQQERRDLAARYWLVRTYKHLADESFEQLVKQFPDSWRTHQFRAESDQLRYAYDDAITEYEASITLHRDDPELHQRLSQLYLEKKDFLGAEKELRKAIQLDPGGSRSLYLLGRCRLGEGQERESIPLLQQALRLDPGLLEAHAAMGRAYMRLKQPERARPELEKALAIDVHGDLHFLLFVAYRDLGKPDLAQKALAVSQELRENAAARQQAKIAQVVEP
jgi:tetratricopeptide (TPR) repeat protein